MRELEAYIHCAAQSDAAVMITGESGVGKTFVAQRIHRCGRRGQGPFIIANCVDLLQSRPTSDRSVLGTAQNGTLVMREVEKLSLPMQTQLLRLIEGREARSGSGQPSRDHRDVRLMTVTTPHLWERVRSNEFAEVLFYRLNIFLLMVPPLRERCEDVPILLRQYLTFYGCSEARRLSPAAWDRLVAYPWPGNVRELKAVAGRLARGDPRDVEPDDLPPEIRGGADA